MSVNKRTKMSAPIFLFGKNGRVVRLLCVFLLLSWPVSGRRVIKYPPRMIRQPPSSRELLFQVAVGQSENDKPFIIECEAEGVPAPSYRWIKNGKPFNWQIYDERMSQQPNRGTLVITSPREEDLGQYQCLAENELGVATSNSVFARRALLNNFENRDPVTVTVDEGQPVTLRCRPPNGYPKPYVYWVIQDDGGALRSINSTRISFDPMGHLRFANVTREDESNGFTYACSATSSFRNEYKLGTKTKLKVNEIGSSSVQIKNSPMPQFTSRRNNVLLRGTRMRLFCIFSGTPLPQIRWVKKNGVLPADRIEYWNYGKTLVIDKLEFEDEGTYECEATNGVGRAKSHTMNVQVNARPFFTVEPEIQNKAEGETAIFECEAEGRPKPKINWIFNGNPIEEAAPKPNRKISKNVIQIFNLTMGDIGNYGCNATNEHGYVYKDVYLNVLALPPEILVQPADVRTVDGSDVSMSCEVFGAPEPRISWIRDDQELTGGRYVLDAGHLIIHEVQFTDEGEYTCLVENKFGRVSSQGSLEVKRRTKITDSPQDYEVAAGSTATFRCNAVADPGLELSIDWMIDDKQIDFEREPRFVMQPDNSLSITKTTELDSGVFTCVASTELDEATTSATLIVQDVPNAPQLSMVECHDREASISWTPMGDNRAPIFGYTIQYNTSFAPDTWEDSFRNVPATSNRIEVEMSPWANYTFRVIAQNKIGQSMPSGHSKICSTPEDVPFKNPDGVQGKGTSPTNLVIKWSPMQEIEHNGPGFKYRVYWKRDDLPEEKWNSEEVVEWDRDHIVVEGRPTFKPFRIKVEAHNDRGEAKETPVPVIGYSGEDVPLEAPNNLTLVEVVNPTTARFGWDSVAPESIRGHFKGFKIQTWFEGRDESQARDILVERREEQVTEVDSLVPFMKNYVRVLVFNGAYDGPPSQVVEVEMPEGSPGPVNSLEAIPLGSSGFLVQWQPPKRPNGVLIGYHIYYQEVRGTNTGPTSERIPPILDPTRTRAKLANLVPGTKYRLTVKARTQAGLGSAFFIERSTEDIEETPPGKPTFIWQHILTENGDSVLKITFIPDESNPGSSFFTQYKRYGENIFSDSKHEFNEDFLFLEGLEPSQTYEIRVVAVDGVYHTASDVQEIYTSTSNSNIYGSRDGGSTILVAKSWFIGMILTILFLFSVLAVVCVFRKSRIEGLLTAYDSKDFNQNRGFISSTQTLDSGTCNSDSKGAFDFSEDSISQYTDCEIADTEYIAAPNGHIGHNGMNGHIGGHNGINGHIGGHNGRIGGHNGMNGHTGGHNGHIGGQHGMNGHIGGQHDMNGHIGGQHGMNGHIGGQNGHLPSNGHLQNGQIIHGPEPDSEAYTNSGFTTLV